MSSTVSNDDAPLLVGDIGSTNARFGLAEIGTTIVLRDVVTLRCAAFPGLVEAVTHYLSGISGPRPRVAAIAIAGPQTGDRLSLTNNPWSFSVAETRKALRLERLEMLNDFTALALSLPSLPAEGLAKVGEGVPAIGEPLAVIGPGTGLGVSGVIRIGDRWTALAGEGGHATFAPVTDREFDIGLSLRQRFGHVSWERLLSGPGLVNLYVVLAELSGQRPEALSPPDVTQRALDRSCAICAEAVDVFCAALGTVAGDLALTLGARGGVYIGGGIVPKLEAYFRDSDFRRRFEAKGRFSHYLAEIPTYVIIAPYPALVGAAIALDTP